MESLNSKHIARLTIHYLTTSEMSATFWGANSTPRQKMASGRDE